MFSNLKYKTYSEKKQNEDTYGYGEDYLFVIDGATGLGHNDYMGIGDDAAWFVLEMKEYIHKNFSKNKDVISLLENGCSYLLEKYRAKSEESDYIDMPSACIAFFYIVEDTLHFFGLGDCYGIVELKDGSIEVFYDENLERLDGIAIKEMVKIAKEKQIAPIKARPYIHELLRKHRNLRNKENGYYSLDLSGEGVQHGIQKSWPLKDVKRILSVSDGFYEVMQYSLYKDHNSLLDAIEINEEEVFMNLYNTQEKDSEGYTLPRFKIRDDITFIYAKIK